MAQDRFEQAYTRWYPAVVRSAWSITRDVAVAEELAQEAFVKAYGRWRRLTRGGHAEPWIHRAVMNLALSWLRRQRRGRQLEAYVGDYSSAPPADRLAGSDDEVVGLLARLSRRQREAVFLRVVADLAETEVAALMGCSVGSVKVHKKRGLEALRDLLDQRPPATAPPPARSLRPSTGTSTGASHVAN